MKRISTQATEPMHPNLRLLPSILILWAAPMVACEISSSPRTAPQTASSDAESPQPTDLSPPVEPVSTPSKPPEVVALIRDLEDQPVPLYESVSMDSSAQGDTPLTPGPRMGTAPSATRVWEITDVESMRHHKGIAAYELRLETGETAWVEAQHVLLAGNVITLARDQNAQVFQSAEANSPVVDSLISEELIFFNPIDYNPFDGRPGCHIPFIRVRTLRDFEGYAPCELVH